MIPARAGSKILASLAILFLLGFGFVVYAVPGAASPSPLDGSSPATASAAANGLSYTLVPLPVYLDKEAPSNYSFREGGALIVVSGNQLTVTTSFLGAADTQFFTVVQTADQNVTAGAVTTTSMGGGVFRGNITLAPGTYEIGLLVFVSGDTASPVAVSIPRAIEVTLPVTAQTSSTTTTTRSPSSSSSSGNEEHNTTTTSASEVTTTSASSSESPHMVDLLQFAPVANSSAPIGYLYGKGAGGYAVADGSIRFSLGFTGQKPSTHYSLVLSVNGTSRTIGDYTTNEHGGATTEASTALGTGSFLLSLSVVDLTSFNAPTTVMASVPSTFTVSTHATSTSTTSTSTTESSTATGTPSGAEWTFKLTPAVITNAPSGYRFAKSGTAVVLLDSEHSLLNVVLGFQDANPSTAYSAVLVLNGSSISLGSMTTNRGGAAVLHSSIQVSPGTYLLGLMVYDVSDIAAFKASGPVLVMLSDPNTQLAVIVPNARGESSTHSETNSGASQGSSTSQSVVTNTVTTTVTTMSAGSEVEAQIQDAVDNLTIPATVQITPLLKSTTVLDSRFSLSVGQQVGNGLVIAISGENVTGPRVLLINMSKTAPLSLYPSLNVTLDGVPVVEASSALQVLNPTPSDPARYVLVATTNSIQLLVSIPHFSLHLIQVAGQIVHNIQSSLALDAPLLAGSIIVITLAFAGAYAARKRYFSILL